MFKNKYFWFCLIVLITILDFIYKFIIIYNYPSFGGDTLVDAIALKGAFEGRPVYYGPISSYGGYYLGPLTYYFILPFAYFTSDPRWYVIYNLVFSVLTIPLIYIFIKKLLSTYDLQIQNFVGFLAALWWGITWGNYYFGALQWVSTTIPFFILSFYLVAEKVWLQNTRRQNIIWSIALGFIYAMFISIHSTTLFIFIPLSVVFATLVLWKKKNWLSVLLTTLSLVISLTPYWIGEFNNKFWNTKRLILTILNVQNNEVVNKTFLLRLDRVFFNYLELFTNNYFSGFIGYFVGGVFITLGIMWFRGNRLLFNLMWLVNAIYFVIASNYDGTYHIYYKYVFALSPVIFAAIIIAYLFDLKNVTFSNLQSDNKYKWLNSLIKSFNYLYSQKYLMLIFVFSVILISFTTRLPLYKNFLLSRSGADRLISYTDQVEISKKLDNQTICEDNLLKDNLKYISKYITKSTFTTSQNNCYDVFLKYKTMDNQNLVKVNAGKDVLDNIFYENDVFIIFRKNITT